MTQEEIIEGNKLIAEFMGAEFDMSHYHVTDSYIKEDGEKVFKYQQGTAYYEEGKEPTSRVGQYPMTSIKYHSSWDWLMPVVDKCLKIHSWDMLVEKLLDCDISGTWGKVVEFIKWDNLRQ